MMTTIRPDIAIVGAGLAGRLLAWRLAREGVRVALYERGDAHGQDAAAWVAASMLAPLAESAVAEPLLVELGVASLSRWPQWLAALPSPVYFQRNGTLVLWHAADHAEAVLFQRRVIANTPAHLREGGVLALDAIALDATEPALGRRFKQGWMLPGEGQLDNRQLLAALDLALAELGVPIHAGQAIDDSNWPDAGLTIDCRGLGAKGAVSGLRGVRGEVARVHAPGVRLQRPIRLLHPRYPIYIAPKEHDLYVIGATELETDDRSPVSVRSALELLSAAFSVHPGFGEARIVELNAQCRPTLPDHRPSIALTRVPGTGQPRLSVNGLYRHGFMIAPEVVHEATGLVMTLLGKPAPRDALPARFDAWRASSLWSALFAAPTPAVTDTLSQPV